jgi:hypothetical protein
VYKVFLDKPISLSLSIFGEEIEHFCDEATTSLLKCHSFQLNHSREGEKKEKYQKEVMHPVDY